MTLADAVPDGAVVLVDTNPLIYFLEGSRMARPFASLFSDIDRGRIEALVTPITVAEVVAGPLRARKDALAERYRQALTAGPGFRCHDIDADGAMLAARLRIAHGLKLPDAIQLAVAISAGCFALVTHDRDFRDVSDVRILGLG